MTEIISNLMEANLLRVFNERDAQRRAATRKWFISALSPKQLDAMIEISTAVSGNLAQPHPESIR